MIEIPKNIKNDLDLIISVCDELKMTLYVVGGFPRDIVFDFGVDEETDLDVTEKNGNAFDLAFFVAAKYGLPDPIIYESSGTALITLESGRKVEFHNAYYNVPHIVDELFLKKIEPTPINKDVFSRDFTINTLLLDPKSLRIFDLTEMAIHDIENKILRTPLSPMKGFAVNPKNILRGVRFKAQFGLKSDSEYDLAVKKNLPALIYWLQAHPNSKMVQSTVEKAFEYNPEIAYEEFDKIGIIKFLPKQSEIDSIIKQKMFGTKIIPLAQKAPSGMIQRLMNERENHKAYLRRKKRERSQYLEKKLDILDKAKSGYYNTNSEVTYLKNKERNIRRFPGYEYIKHPR